MNIADEYQQHLLEQAQYIYHETPISEATQQAYLTTPRHLFVKRQDSQFLWNLKP